MLKHVAVARGTVAHKTSTLVRVSKIVDELTEKEDIFSDLDRTQVMESLSASLEKSDQDLESITDAELMQRIEKAMLIELLSGLLDDLDPDQMAAFDEATERIPQIWQN